VLSEKRCSAIIYEMACRIFGRRQHLGLASGCANRWHFCFTRDSSGSWCDYDVSTGRFMEGNPRDRPRPRTGNEACHLQAELHWRGECHCAYHTPACGDDSETGTIQITSLNSNGAGTAQPSFGSTGFHSYIQVSPNTQVFNLVDISDSANYEEGSAIRQPASIALAKLAGQWEASLFIHGGCGFGTKQLIFFSFANGDEGPGSALEDYDTSGCGCNAENGAIVNTALSTNGFGTSLFNFGSAFNFYIQASPNGQVVNMVDISDVSNYEEGMAIVQDNSTAATPTVSELAGSWQATLFIDGGCGLGTKLFSFELGSPLPGSDLAQGIAAAEYHTQGCGNNTETGTIRDHPQQQYG
jgi:hypothetical protein